MQLAWRSAIDKHSEQYDQAAYTQRRHPVTTMPIWFLRSYFVLAVGDVVVVYTTPPAMRPNLNARPPSARPGKIIT